MKLVREFFRRITDDLKHKKLLPLKILFFVHASTILVLYPYLTIHMRELGINVEETAVMSAVTPIVFFVMPPLAGLLADKIGNFRLLLAISSSLGGAAALLLLAVPVGRLTLTYPTDLELVAQCDSGSLVLKNIQDYPCLTKNITEKYTNFKMLSCGFVCDLPLEMSFEEKNAIAQMRFYDVRLKSSDNLKQIIFQHSISGLTNTSPTKKERSNSHVLKNDPFFDKLVRKLSDRQMFFPAPNLYQFECDTNETNTTCYFGKDEIGSLKIVNATTHVKDIFLSLTRNHTSDNSYVHMKSEYTSNNLFWASGLQLKNAANNNERNTITCNDKLKEEPHKVIIRAGSRLLQQCSSACASTAPRNQVCSNLKQQVEIDPSFTFWIYLAVRMFIGIISGTAFAMFEGAVIAVIREQKADYGLQRAYGSVGGMISSPLSGLLIDYASRGKDYTDFRPAFYLYAVLKIATGALMLSIDLEFKQPAQNLLQDVITVFKNIEMVALFMACFIMGTAWGYIESFLFWLLKDMDASSSLMGFTVTVGGVAGLPLLVFSGPIIHKLGHANVLFIGFIFYAIRLLGYSLIYNPWLCLIFEAMESVTSSLSFTAAVTYAARLSSTSTDTSVQGLLGGVYYGVGVYRTSSAIIISVSKPAMKALVDQYRLILFLVSTFLTTIYEHFHAEAFPQQWDVINDMRKGTGSLIGGFLMKAFGTRPTYQIFAVATFITGCIYYLFNRFYIQKYVLNTIVAEPEKKTVQEDIECIESIEKDIIIDNKETSKLTDKQTDLPKDTQVSNGLKCATDNIDGSSDSGVDNPNYSETESPSCEIKK